MVKFKLRGKRQQDQRHQNTQMLRDFLRWLSLLSPGTSLRQFGQLFNLEKKFEQHNTPVQK